MLLKLKILETIPSPPAPNRTRNSSVFPTATKGGRGNPRLAALTRGTQTPGWHPRGGGAGSRELPNSPASPPRPPPPSSDPGETFTAQPHAQEDRGYPSESQKPLTSEIPPVTFAEPVPRPLGGQVRIAPGQVREVTQGRPARRGASGSAAARPRTAAWAPAPFPRPFVSPSPAKLLGESHLQALGVPN